MQYTNYIHSIKLSEKMEDNISIEKMLPINF